MSQEVITKLKHLSRENELDMTFIDDRIVISGGRRIVTYWPESKARTAYADKAKKGIKHATAAQIIQLALTDEG